MSPYIYFKYFIILHIVTDMVRQTSRCAIFAEIHGPNDFNVSEANLKFLKCDEWIFSGFDFGRIHLGNNYNQIRYK